MQEYDWGEVEADGSAVKGAATQSNDRTLRRKVQQPLGKILEPRKLKPTSRLKAAGSCGVG